MSLPNRIRQPFPIIRGYPKESELLNNFPFAKAKSISPAKAQLMEEIKEAVENLNFVKQEKIKAIAAKELLDEL